MQCLLYFPTTLGVHWRSQDPKRSGGTVGMRPARAAGGSDLARFTNGESRKRQILVRLAVMRPASALRLLSPFFLHQPPPPRVVFSTPRTSSTLNHVLPLVRQSPKCLLRGERQSLRSVAEPLSRA
ncbi:hypothetical protein GSI_14329 [Ganoderma sinense ZZ0214-1]|uniref:Uncharacterized protein n=1 Tax=Ganoderma sinense ZZ0214-1 TaxID=1077348 RepID=A0A2G8RNC6_9APHY|nr:hypothetical protein GSI_14329 [Ganoderma sinense ZZ0214-1]